MKEYAKIIMVHVLLPIIFIAGFIYILYWFNQNYETKVVRVSDELIYCRVLFKIEDCEICELKPVVNYETIIKKETEKPEFIFKVVGISKSFKRSTGERIITHFDLGQGPI